MPTLVATAVKTGALIIILINVAIPNAPPASIFFAMIFLAFLRISLILIIFSA